MKINKEFILKNLITICCAASIILLFLPFANVSVSLESSFINASGSTTITGFDTIGGESSSLFSWLMLISPIVLVAMNYIKQLDKYKSILAIILPIVSVISAVCTLLLPAPHILTLLCLPLPYQILCRPLCTPLISVRFQYLCRAFSA